MIKNKRYFIELTFDGSNYHGWQIQENAISVQGTLNKALNTLLRRETDTIGCGRTDTGVHAKQLFAHFDVFDNQTDVLSSAFLKSMNAILPNDIVVKRIIAVSEKAHARFDATLRSYAYHIHFQKDPFKRKYSWLLRDRPVIDLMNNAAAIIKEYHDFSCFTKSNTQVKTNLCTILKSEWKETEQGIVFHVSADRFLRNMVRAMVGTLLMVGHQEIEPEAVRNIIESKNRSSAGVSVPACGLFLTEVKYVYLS
ncbi:MAG: tRNA pseudouridine(38-40) synthase TruA [Sphingobacteriaceae bacterium]